MVAARLKMLQRRRRGNCHRRTRLLGRCVLLYSKFSLRQGFRERSVPIRGVISLPHSRKEFLRKIGCSRRFSTAEDTTELLNAGTELSSVRCSTECNKNAGISSRCSCGHTVRCPIALRAVHRLNWFTAGNQRARCQPSGTRGRGK